LSEFDFARLERVVAQLVEEQGDLRKVNGGLRAQLSERGTRVRALEEQLRTANQLRQDVAKRIDELIGQIDQLDAELEGNEA
jgi:chromosome segregation ATPase